MNKKTIPFFILAIILIFIIAGCAQITKERHPKNKIAKINSNTENNNLEKNLLKPGDYKHSLKQGKIERYYLLHIPQNHKEDNQTKLVLVFHGGMGNAEHMRDNYDWIEKSEKEGFIVAFPNGYSRFESGAIGTWNAGRCCGFAAKENSNDVEFVKMIIEDIQKKTSIDKIFATGMSNGGMLSHRLACEIPSVFTAVAAVAGTNNYDNCNPNKPISVMNIHGLLDDHVLYEGGCGPKCILHNETEFTSVPKTLSDWVNRNNCSNNPERVFENKNGYCDLYSECKDEVEVKLCIAKDGGHSWPGIKNSNPNILEKTNISQAFSATDLIWDFFKTK